MSLQSETWLDGIPTSMLPLPDRGVDFGDGIFETLLVQQGKPLFTQLHLDRLKTGLQALQLPDCLADAQQQIDLVATALARKNWHWAVLRLSVIRGPGLRGYTPSDNTRPRILIRVHKMDSDCRQLAIPANLGVASIRLSAQPALAGIKHLNRLEQVLAAAQSQAEGFDECVVLDQQDQIVSVIAGNLFLVHRGELLTPTLLSCGILGTRRRLIIEKWAPSLRLKVRETSLALSHLEDADEIFYSNSLLTVRPIHRLGELSWEDHSVCEALFQCYLEELA